MKQGGEGHLQRWAVDCVRGPRKIYVYIKKNKHMMSTSHSVNESGRRQEWQS